MLETTRTNATFICAALVDKDLVMAPAVLDADAEEDYFTRIYSFDEQRKDIWTHHDVEKRIKAASVYLLPPEFEDFGFCTISDEGDVTLYCDSAPGTEKIPGAGLWSADSAGWGYMSALKQIGDHLYATGGAGQVYKRLGPNQWVHMDEGILQRPDVDQRLLPRAIDGPNESAIYLVGSISAPYLPPFVYFWNGKVWRRLDLPEVAERITHIHVESDDRIWMCGANGTLLLGNATDGFESLSTVDDNQLFLSVMLFKGKAYLGSNLGLFVYDPADHAAGILKVLTGMQPELQDANIVDAVDGVLWSIGPKDIARFDGKQWERIHHPDNPRIGG